ncbi:DUF6193 family natural product biosynthesis protein [Streptomyces bambusae]|uniref:DUF6193 family natural product biosynthesis protein n=1 Tax=Streptomyces bambusae TaxID=1550616 RepID=UPI001CA5F305
MPPSRCRDLRRRASGVGRERIGGAHTAEEAVEIAAAHLPAGWGPAVDGKPDILEPLN